MVIFLSFILSLYYCQKIIALLSHTFLNIGWFYFQVSNIVAPKIWVHFLDASFFTYKKNKKHKVCLTDFCILLMLNHVCEWWKFTKPKIYLTQIILLQYYRDVTFHSLLVTLCKINRCSLQNFLVTCRRSFS